MISVDGIHTLLAQSQRRCVLFLLLESDSKSINVDELVEYVAVWGHDQTPMSSDRETRDRIEVSLVHNHLPRLDAHSIVDFEREAGTITRGPAFDDVVPYLEATVRMESDERRSNPLTGR